MGWKRLGLKDWDSDGRETNANTSDDSSSDHLTVGVTGCLDCSTNNDCGQSAQSLMTSVVVLTPTYDVRDDDTPLAANLLAEEECSNSTERAADIVDGGDEPSQGWRRIAEHLNEAITGQNASEKTLVIAEEEEVEARGGEDDRNEPTAPELGHDGDGCSSDGGVGEGSVLSMLQGCVNVEQKRQGVLSRRETGCSARRSKQREIWGHLYTSPGPTD